MQRVWSWIELVLRQYPWALTLAAMVPCAYFDAAGVNHLVASSLFKADVDSLARPAAAPAGADSASQHDSSNHHMRDVHQILARDVFDSTAGCLNCPVVASEDAGVSSGDGAVEVASGRPEPCTGTAKVTGAVIIEDPLWSFAFVSANGHDPPMPFRFGQTIDGKQVSAVGWETDVGAYVVLRQGPTRCYFAQFMPVHAAAPDAGTVAHAADAGTGGMSSGLLAELDHGIERNGNEFSVRRSLVNQILENQAELMRTTRIMPQMQDGRVVGVSLFGVRPDSLLGRLGMQNGDVLSRINGLEIGTPDRALEAYSRLQTADRISLSVLRNNQPVNIDFNIHQ